jgi:hypothetical protein
MTGILRESGGTQYAAAVRFSRYRLWNTPRLRGDDDRMLNCVPASRQIASHQPLDDPVRTKRGNRILVIAEIREHAVGMLAERRGPRSDLAWRFRQPHGDTRGRR